jgi:hypothetical protein
LVSPFSVLDDHQAARICLESRSNDEMGTVDPMERYVIHLCNALDAGMHGSVRIDIILIMVLIISVWILSRESTSNAQPRYRTVIFSPAFTLSRLLYFYNVFRVS